MVRSVRRTPLVNVPVGGPEVTMDEEVLFPTGGFEVESEVLPTVGSEDEEVPMGRLGFELIMSDFTMRVIMIRL